jgi:zinc transporter ZupT
MINFFYELNPLIQTILASSITFFATSMGAFIVYLLKFNSKRLTNILLGIGAGIMLAAAFFSLLIPAIEQAKLLNFNHYIVISFIIIYS